MIEWVLIHSRTAGEWVPSLRTDFSSISFTDWFPLHGQYRRRHTCLVNTKMNSLKRSKKKQSYHKYQFLNFILEMDVHIVEQDSNVTWAMVTQDWSIFLDSSLNLSARSWKPEAKRAENFQKVLKAMGLVWIQSMRRRRSWMNMNE